VPYGPLRCWSVLPRHSLIQPWGLSKLLENVEGTPLGAIAEASAGKSVHA
jgi:hypothetical protein